MKAYYDDLSFVYELNTDNDTPSLTIWIPDEREELLFLSRQVFEREEDFWSVVHGLSKSWDFKTRSVAHKEMFNAVPF